MANTITDLIPDLYEALDVISRELVGFIPAVSRDSNAERAAKGQTVDSPVVPEISTEDITPGDTPSDSGDQTISTVSLSISKAKAAPVRWTGEEERAVRTGGQYSSIQSQRFAQAMRALVNEVETDIGGLFSNASRVYGTAGTTPFGSDLSDMAELLKILKDNGAPTNSLKFVMDTAAGANLRSLTNLTNVNQAGTDRTLRDGALLDIHGFEMRESAGVQTKDTSSESDTGTTTVNGNHSEGATSISIASATDSVTLIPGNYITIGDHKYMMVMDSNVTISSGSNETVTIAEPGLMTDVSGGTSVTQNTTDFAANMGFAESAIHLVTRAPAMPSGGDAADDVMEIQDDVSGLAFQVAMYKQYRRVKYEVGLAWGWQMIAPRHAALLLG